MDIYDIALMPLDALSAIAFDLPPNEFQLDPRYISSALPYLYLYRMCHSCATRALEMESPSLNAHTHACLTVYSALQKCLAWKDRQREVSTFFPVPPLLPSRFTLCNEFIIVHFVSAFFEYIASFSCSISEQILISKCQLIKFQLVCVVFCFRLKGRTLAPSLSLSLLLYFLYLFTIYDIWK